MKKLFKKTTYKDFVINHTRKILFVCNLDDFIITHTSLDKENTKEGVAATMDVDYEYLRATLSCDDKYFEKVFKEKRYDELLNILCHEIAHIITSELPDLVGLDYKGQMKFYLERSTERVGRLIHRLYIKWMEQNKINIQTGI